ncbi:AraC-like DNA-binding protein [Mycolicibacterium sp. BK556]|uniref:helix-turn-helix transcriptional regulator n=1 Tax=unclassified Mycolicibacterium TaxID=2636767 RepID=UPI00161612CF|nr:MULTISPECIES: AraC family transcriptional regulator [unclassified Mycolicibacterium]MBB3601437.1 AraC-like DNA-binding protein [Mycolicibacterium sp. BK556]MBB3631189.1 AraC-like DNA-binding protein [Mycolicibacterium sp. BK607]
MLPTPRPVRHRAGVPIYEYPTDPATPPVTVLRLHPDGPPEKSRHIHGFPIMTYLPDTASVCIVAAGETIDPAIGEDTSRGIAVFFDPSALADGTHSPWPAWRRHPLLFPFLHGRPGGVLRISLPDSRKAFWDSMIESMEAELTVRRDGYRPAVLAQLTLLLIDLARMTEDLVHDLRRSGEPLIADVFTVIDRQLGKPISLRDVAQELGLTPGHLTTVVRRRTGRTVGEWILERRMAQARILLRDNSISVTEVAHRVGISDAGYFGRVFLRVHGLSPRQWRALESTGRGAT